MKLYITNGRLECATDAPAADSILWKVDSRAEHLHVPEGVVCIGKNAFREHRSITTLTLPDSLECIEAGALENCTYLKQIVLSPNHSAFRMEGKWLISNDNVLIRALSDVREAIIPEGVIRIEEGAFSDCVNLRTVSLPASVTDIGKRAFYWCATLTDFNFSEGLLNIEEEAFVLCKQLTHVALPSSLVRLGANTFAQCSELRTITLPDSLAHIGGGIVHACERFERLELSENHPNFQWHGKLLMKQNAVVWAQPDITEAIVPEGVTQIADGAFKWCKDLKSLSLPDSLISIGAEAFSCCFTLKDMSIPDSVESIGQRAFYDCEALTTLHLPASIREIGAEAFCDCRNLTTLSMKKGIVKIGKGAFGGYNKFTSVDVPEEYFLPAMSEPEKCEAFYPFPIQFMPQALILSACRCFLKDISLYPSEVHEGYWSCIRRRADELMKEAFDHPEWLYKLIQKNLIPDESIDAYLDEAILRGNEEWISRLQVYLYRKMRRRRN